MIATLINHGMITLRGTAWGCVIVYATNSRSITLTCADGSKVTVRRTVSRSGVLYELVLEDADGNVLLTSSAQDALCADRMSVEVEEEDIEREDAWELVYLILTAVRYGWHRRAVVVYDDQRCEYRLVNRVRASEYAHVLEITLLGLDECDDDRDEEVGAV